MPTLPAVERRTIELAGLPGPVPVAALPEGRLVGVVIFVTTSPAVTDDGLLLGLGAT